MDPKAIADAIVDSVRSDYVGRALSDHSIAEVFHYGAVDIDPNLLVIWLLLSGSAEDIPERYFPPSVSPKKDSPFYVAPNESLLSRPKDADQYITVRDEIRERFRKANWPSNYVDIGFDSCERVAAEGGWHYFNS